MSVTAQAAACPAPSAPSREARRLRWTFRRDDETVICDLGLTPDESAYELRVQPPWNPTGTTVEVFDDAVSAFQRHGVIERILINEGWSLERFESAFR